MQAQGRDDVTVCFFGEGATGHGRVRRGAQHRRALEAAARLHLREQPVRRADARRGARRRARSGAAPSPTGCPAQRVDGNDVDAVADAVGGAVARARARRRPDADRGRHLSLVRPLRRRRAAYRVEDEVREWRARDPLIRSRAAARRRRRRRARRRGRGGDRRRARVRPRQPVTGPDALALDHYATLMTHDERHHRDTLAEVLAGHQPGADRGDGARRARRPRRRGRRPPGGPYGVTRGLLDKFGDVRVRDTPISEAAARRPRRRRRRRRPAADRRDHVLRLRDDRDGPDRQPGREVPLLLRPLAAARDPHDVRRRRPERRAALAELRGLVLRRARAEGRHAVQRRPTPRGCSSPRSATTTRSSSSRRWAC